MTHSFFNWRIGVSALGMMASACGASPHQEHLIVLQQTTVVPESSDTSREYQCVRQQFRESFYWFCSSAQTWTSARAVCRSMQSDLVTINDDQENLFLENRARQLIQTPRGFFIGLSDNEQEGVFRWVDGSYSAQQFQAWRANEPNNAGTENCTEIIAYVGNSEGGWNDISCDSARPFVCEINTSR